MMYITESDFYGAVEDNFTEIMHNNGFSKKREGAYQLNFEGGKFEYIIAIVGDCYPKGYIIAFNARITLDYINNIHHDILSLSNEEVSKIDDTIISTQNFGEFPKRRGFEIQFENELINVMQELLNRLKTKIFPFFDKYSDIEQIDKTIQQGDFSSH